MAWCFIKNRDMITFVSSLCNGIITRLCQLAYIIVVVVIIITTYRVTLFCHVIGFGEFRFIMQFLCCDYQVPVHDNHFMFIHISKIPYCTTLRTNMSLVNFQLDDQNSYLFTYNTFIKILYMFRALSCSSSVGLHRNCVYAASGIVTLCR
jgi:hypothetical protein